MKREKKQRRIPTNKVPHPQSTSISVLNFSHLFSFNLRFVSFHFVFFFFLFSLLSFNICFSVSFLICVMFIWFHFIDTFISISMFLKPLWIRIGFPFFLFSLHRFIFLGPVCAPYCVMLIVDRLTIAMKSHPSGIIIYVRQQFAHFGSLL